MMTIAWLSVRLRRLARSERGMALPTALFAMVASLGLAGAAVMSTVDVQHGSQRDSGSKSAIAAADAGANVAMMRINRDREELGTSSCLEGATPSAGWCPAVSGDVGGATYEYRVTDAAVGCGEFDLCAVVTGTVGEVSRRVLISFDQGLGGPGSGGSGGDDDKEGTGGGAGSGAGAEGLIGKESITLSGNADIRVGIGSDGNITYSGSATVCPGNIRYGVGKSTNLTPCTGYKKYEGNVTLPPVSEFMPADIATNNSNARITTCNKSLPVGCQTDTYSSKFSTNSPFNPTTRRISVSGSKSLTLRGGDYWLCEISMSGNSELIMAEGAHIRIFFDTPENCGTSSPLNLSGTVRIVASGYQPDKGQFDLPGFFILGSATKSTSLNISGNVKNEINEIVVYAPNTNINLSGNSTYKGLIAGRTITVSGSAVFENDKNFVLPPTLNPWYEEEPIDGGDDDDGEPTVAGYFTPQFYVECNGPATPTPDANC
jgi:hypothetical protein